MYIGTQPYQGFRARHTYTATAGQTSFSGAGAENVTLTYSDEMYIDVYQNGVKLSPADYTATSGTTVVLATGATVSDIVEVVKYDAFSVADTVSAKDGGGFGGNISTSGNLAVTGTSAFTGAITSNAGVVVDNITIDGTEIDLSSGDLTIDVAGDITLDAGGQNIRLKDDGTEFGQIYQSSNDLHIFSSVSDADFKLQGNDGGSTITALSFDMSDAGTATFNHDIKLADNSVISLGAGNDFEVFSDGSNGVLKAPNLDLYLQSDSKIRLTSEGNSETLAIFNKDGASELYHDNSKKFETTSSGVDVTGAISADGEIDCASSSSLSTISATATGSCNLVMGTNFSGSASQGMANQSGFLNMRQDFPIIFGTSETERMRIFGNGNITFSTTDQSPAEGTSTGGRIGTSGKLQLSATGDQTVVLNRLQDGSVLGFRSAGTAEGGISISGNTVSFNAFSGSHWSRLTDNSKPTILKGTIIETIDEMCDWYQAEFEADGTTKKVGYALKDGEKVGDTITYTYKQDDVEDADYQATIIKEKDNKHTKCKISDTADSKRVYGVFADWDNDDDTVNDMYVTAVGTHVVRINKDVTVTAGDLLSSNGDGTAKVQDDDIIRSKTIGKVLTNIKQETYDDGSYTVPCALYCG